MPVNRNKFWGWHMWSSEMLRACTAEHDPTTALEYLDRAAEYGRNAFLASTNPKERALSCTMPQAAIAMRMCIEVGAHDTGHDSTERLTKFWGWQIASSEALREATREVDADKARQFLHMAAVYGERAFTESANPTERMLSMTMIAAAAAVKLVVDTGVERILITDVASVPDPPAPPITDQRR